MHYGSEMKDQLVTQLCSGDLRGDELGNHGNHENAVIYTGRNFEGFPRLLGL